MDLQQLYVQMLSELKQSESFSKSLHRVLCTLMQKVVALSPDKARMVVLHLDQKLLARLSVDTLDFSTEFDRKIPALNEHFIESYQKAYGDRIITDLPLSEGGVQILSDLHVGFMMTTGFKKETTNQLQFLESHNGGTPIVVFLGPGFKVEREILDPYSPYGKKLFGLNEDAYYVEVSSDQV